MAPPLRAIKEAAEWLDIHSFISHLSPSNPPPTQLDRPPFLFPSPSHRPSPPADVSGQPQSQVGFGAVGQRDESRSAGCVRRIRRSDQQLHRGDIKVVEACGERHLALRLTEASVSCQHTHTHTRTPTFSLPPTSQPAGDGKCFCLEIHTR